MINTVSTYAQQERHVEQRAIEITDGGFLAALRLRLLLSLSILFINLKNINSDSDDNLFENVLYNQNHILHKLYTYFQNDQLVTVRPI